MTDQLNFALIEDSPTDQLIFQDMLEQAFPTAKVQSFCDAQTFLAGFDKHRFDCVVTDNRLPDATGLELVQDLHRHPSFEFVPIIMLTGLGDESTAVKAIKRGASDYISKREASPESLKSAIVSAIDEKQRDFKKAEVQKSLAQQALTDSLTGLLNRNAFDTRLRQALEQARSRQETCTLVYIDLDQFKPINDQFGHNAGDQVLRSVASRLRKIVRAGDSVYRLGGDEFAILLTPAPTPGELEDLAERLMHHLREPVPYPDQGTPLQIGASVGTARFPAQGENAEQLTHAADQAMYQAKRSGSGICIP